MKKLFLLSFGLLFFTIAQAQHKKQPSQAVYFELGGNSLFYTFNYDFRFTKTQVEGWGMQVGAGGYYREKLGFFTLPVVVNRLFGKDKHFFEVGAGVTLMAFRSRYYDWDCGPNNCSSTVYNDRTEIFLPIHGSPNAMGTLNFGYRRIPVEGGVMWKINLTPLFNRNGFWPLFAGASVGYAF